MIIKYCPIQIEAIYELNLTSIKLIANTFPLYPQTIGWILTGFVWTELYHHSNWNICWWKQLDFSYIWNSFFIVFLHVQNNSDFTYAETSFICVVLKIFR